MDKDEIRKHYENVKAQSITGRELLDTIKIRKFNNFIKTVLIKEHVKADNSVLDIGCGHGGDLNKFNKMKISEYCGIDVSENSIAEAQTRYKGSTIRFLAKFLVCDAYHEKLALHRKFDVVSIQFSFHYAFSSEESIKTTLGNINRNLKIGGVVIATIPNETVLLRRYEKYGNGYGNNFYRIKFKNKYEDVMKNKDKPGQSYEFFLKDSLENCVEYLVNIENLKKEAEIFGLEVTENIDFITYFNSKINEYEVLNDIIIGDRLTQNELAVCALYSVLIIKKNKEV